MPAVFVHGVPETARVWDPLRAHLSRADTVALELPGFGTPRPEGFAATKDAYVEWLVAELEALGEPVDLVGHDWGGGFVLRLVSIRPDLVRSWVTDIAAMADPDWRWHDVARVWQTPGDGELFWEELRGAPGDWAAGLELMGVPADAAADMSTSVDETMAGCILDLYRSATEVQADWGPDFADVEPPGLAVVPTEDPFVDAAASERAAGRAGARVVPLHGEGHFWMLAAPDQAAALLQSFWTFG